MTGSVLVSWPVPCCSEDEMSERLAEAGTIIFALICALIVRSAGFSWDMLPCLPGLC